MTLDIFDETWDEVDVSPQSAMGSLAASLSNLRKAGRSTPPSYVAKFFKSHPRPIESILGSTFEVEKVELPGITFYEITTTEASGESLNPNQELEEQDG